MKKIVLLTLILALCINFSWAAAQGNDELQLRLRRNFGYAGGSQIQGSFTISASGSQELSEVVFFMDDQEMGRTTQAPFELRFSTDSYPMGNHTLSAAGKTSTGQELHSKAVKLEFVSAGEGLRAGMRIVIPILVILVAAAALALGLSLLGGRKLQSLPAGAARQYGAAGGAICPRCGRPYPRHIVSPNMMVGKLERCPFCGKWAVVAAAPLDALRQAEQRELADLQPGALPEASEEDKLRKDLEESRYLDG